MHVYEACTGTSEKNARVEIGSLTAFVYSKSASKWQQVFQASKFSGYAYKEAWDSFDATALDIKAMPSGYQGVRAGSMAGTPGNNAHVWGTPAGVFRASVSDFGGVYIVATARVMVDDATKPFNMSGAQYLLGVGADMEPMPDGSGWARLGYGRGKWVKSSWRTFHFTNWNKDQVSAVPPPVVKLPVSWNIEHIEDLYHNQLQDA
jgi:hypothetical protein